MSEVKVEGFLKLSEEENYVIDLINNDPRNKESFIISAVCQSRNLVLIKDKNILHLRLDPTLSEVDYSNDQKLADYLMKLHPLLFDDNLTSERSGDLNRIFIAKGTNLY